MPYSVNTDSNNRVIDYNNSEEIIQENKNRLKQKKIPFYEKKWFKIMTIILITIACSLLVMFVSIKMYKHIEYKIKTDPLSEIQNGGNVKNENDTLENDITKDFDKLATDINKSFYNGTKGRGIQGGKTKKYEQWNHKKVPNRDSKGRFVKTK